MRSEMLLRLEVEFTGIEKQFWLLHKSYSRLYDYTRWATNALRYACILIDDVNSFEEVFEPPHLNKIVDLFDPSGIESDFYKVIQIMDKRITYEVALSIHRGQSELQKLRQVFGYVINCWLEWDFNAIRAAIRQEDDPDSENMLFLRRVLGMRDKDQRAMLSEYVRVTRNWLYQSKDEYAQLSQKMLKMDDTERSRTLLEFEAVCTVEDSNIDRSKFLHVLDKIYRHDVHVVSTDYCNNRDDFQNYLEETRAFDGWAGVTEPLEYTAGCIPAFSSLKDHLMRHPIMLAHQASSDEGDEQPSLESRPHIEWDDRRHGRSFEIVTEAFMIQRDIWERRPQFGPSVAKEFRAVLLRLDYHPGFIQLPEQEFLEVLDQAISEVVLAEYIEKPKTTVIDGPTQRDVARMTYVDTFQNPRDAPIFATDLDDALNNAPEAAKSFGKQYAWSSTPASTSKKTGLDEGDDGDDSQADPRINHQGDDSSEDSDEGFQMDTADVKQGQGVQDSHHNADYNNNDSDSYVSGASKYYDAVSGPIR